MYFVGCQSLDHHQVAGYQPENEAAARLRGAAISSALALEVFSGCMVALLASIVDMSSAEVLARIMAIGQMYPIKIKSLAFSIAAFFGCV